MHVAKVPAQLAIPVAEVTVRALDVLGRSKELTLVLAEAVLCHLFLASGTLNPLVV